MASLNINNLPKLNGTNYHDWKFAIQMALRRSGCWDILTGKEKKPKSGDTSDWEEKSDEALTLIGLTVEPSQYGHIRDANTGPEAWQKLRDVYEKSSRANRIALKRQFYNYRHEPNGPIQEYISGITDLATKLRNIGVTIDDEDITDVLIFNLDESYSNIAGSLTSAKGELTIGDVTGALLDEEGRRRRSSEPHLPDHALQAKFRNRDITCYRCQRKGHIQKDCTANRDINGNRITDNPKKERASLAINNSLLDIMY